MPKVIVGLIDINTTEWTWDPNFTMRILIRAAKALKKKLGSLSYSKEPFRGILLAPEFFFMNPFNEQKGINKPKYNESKCLSEIDKEKITEMCCKLSEKYPDILIIPGTVMWMKHFENQNKKNKLISNRRHYLSKIKDTYEISKSLDVSDGIRKWVGGFDSEGFDDLEKHIKEYDYAMFNTAYGYLDGKICLRYHKRGNYSEESHDRKVGISSVFISGSGDNITKIGKYSIGIEVCYDHTVGMLKYFAEQSKNKSYQNGVDLHILLAGSNDSYGNNVFLKDGNSYFLHADSQKDRCGIFRKRSIEMAKIYLANRLRDAKELYLSAAEKFKIKTKELSSLSSDALSKNTQYIFLKNDVEKCKLALEEAEELHKGEDYLIERIKIAKNNYDKSIKNSKSDPHDKGLQLDLKNCEDALNTATNLLDKYYGFRIIGLSAESEILGIESSNNYETNREEINKKEVKIQFEVENGKIKIKIEENKDTESTSKKKFVIKKQIQIRFSTIDL